MDEQETTLSPLMEDIRDMDALTEQCEQSRRAKLIDTSAIS